MYKLISELFPDCVVQCEASPAWLGRQRLGAFLPDVKFAIEYQGQQHFASVGLFGSEDGWRRAVERDAIKKRLCEENGVTLVYVDHGESLTLANLRRRLQRHILQTG